MVHLFKSPSQQGLAGSNSSSDCSGMAVHPSNNQHLEPRGSLHSFGLFKVPLSSWDPHTSFNQRLPVTHHRTGITLGTCQVSMKATFQLADSNAADRPAIPPLRLGPEPESRHAMLSPSIAGRTGPPEMYDHDSKFWHPAAAAAAAPWQLLTAGQGSHGFASDSHISQAGKAAIYGPAEQLPLSREADHGPPVTSQAGHSWERNISTALEPGFSTEASAEMSHSTVPAAELQSKLGLFGFLASNIERYDGGP